MDFTTTKVWGDKLFRINVSDEGVVVTELNPDGSEMSDVTARSVWIDPFLLKQAKDFNNLQVHIYVADNDPEGKPKTFNVFPDIVVPNI